jgi:Ca2+-binding EF-hand superfamily protein
VASQLVSREEEFQIMEIFRVLDKNGDGTITREELRAGIEIFREKFGLINEIGDNIDELI